RRDEHEEQHLDHPDDEPDDQGGNEERHERGARQPRGTGRRLGVQRWCSGGGPASSSSTSSASAAPFPSCFDSPPDPAESSPTFRFKSSSCRSASAFTSRLWD